MRRLVGTLLAVAIAVAGVIGLIAFFNSRDESTTQSPPAAEPLAEPPKGGDALLKDGNIILRHSDPADAAPLRRLAKDLGAPDTQELRAAGQAVVVRRDPGLDGINAQSFTTDLTVAEPDDPALQAFVERWLGLGDQG